MTQPRFQPQHRVSLIWRRDAVAVCTDRPHVVLENSNE
jgi:hypothetical protein